MSEEKTPEVVEFKSGGSESITIETDSNAIEASVKDPQEEAKPEPKLPEPTEWKGVKFPAYFQGMHFVDVKGSTVMAVDPACLTIEMKANWESIYRPELAALGRQVIEKALDIKIELL